MKIFAMTLVAFLVTTSSAMACSPAEEMMRDFLDIHGELPVASFGSHDNTAYVLLADVDGDGSWTLAKIDNSGNREFHLCIVDFGYNFSNHQLPTPITPNK